MRKLFFLFVFGLLVTAASEMTLTVDQLVAFVKSSVQKKFPDKEVAEYLKHVKVSNKIDDRTVEDLQGLGAGPKTIAALHDLRDSSQNLAPPAPPAPKAVYKQPDPPNSIEQAKILDDAREYALNYEKTLPNYICAEVQRRYVDRFHRNLDSGAGPDWALQDTVTTKLTYFDHQEKYEVQMVNNRSVTNMPIEKLGGAVSRGEFGSMMRAIFDPSSEAHFEWDHWGTLRGRPVYVFSFNIEQPHSKYSIVWEGSQELWPAYRGQIFIDKDTKMIVRIVETPYDIPATYPVRSVNDVLDFDFVKIGDGEYLVPMKAVITSATNNYLARNDKEFRLYRKFGVESNIKFETPDPLPTEKTQEKPPIKP